MPRMKPCPPARLGGELSEGGESPGLHKGETQERKRKVGDTLDREEGKAPSIQIKFWIRALGTIPS